MPYSVWIRDRKTNETVRCEMPYEWYKDDSDDEFWWSEGNFGCDCNRLLTFERAKGNDPEMGKDDKCHYDDFPDGRFQVVSIKLPNGKEVYSEPNDPQSATSEGSA